MQILSLNGTWRLDAPTVGYTNVTATVPGSVYCDLLNAGLIDDPFYRDNETRLLPLMEHEFTYTRRFTADATLLSCEQVLLHCDGLDTLATLVLNGVTVGTADNMHRTWEFDVKAVLREGENELSITFASPTQYIREAYAECPTDGAFDPLLGFSLIRKAHYMCGWDWGPRLPDAGIWRSISLLGIDVARIRDVYVVQHHEADRVTLEIRTHLTELSGTAPVKVTVTAPNGRTWTASGEQATVVIDEPELWWPNGLGAQPLYTVSVELGDGLDAWSRRIGLRTMTVTNEKDEWGESFSHCVNGVNIFAMGADYIPEDNLLSRMSPARTRRLLEDAKAAHFNCIRVWGGGIYPSDDLYDICDELGLLVWQDFAFACAYYNLTEEFEQSILAEFTDNVRRLRHHASLALWCGNNEVEETVLFGGRPCTPQQKNDYVKIFDYLLPKVLKAEDPVTFYWPSSPSTGVTFDETQSPSRGDSHYWQVWHGLKPFTDYRNYQFRYVSEFGFQSFPCMDTIESFTLPEDRNVFSYIMEKHQRNSGANGRIVNYLSQTYLYPSKMTDLIYASQLMQAQAMQYGVEHWRRHRGRCMGAVVWQLNDCWPVASWSSIDYFGRWKALHYYEKRFFAPVLLSCHEEGTLSQDPDVNTQLPRLIKSAHLNVSNETMQEFRGTASWALRRPDASVIAEGSFDVVCPPLSAVWLEEQDFSDEATYDCYYSYELRDENGRTVSEGSVLFCAPKHFHFVDPHLQVRVEGDELVVSADAYARSVEVLAGADVLLSDNYFDLNGGERRIKILRGTAAETVTARSVYDIR